MPESGTSSQAGAAGSSRLIRIRRDLVFITGIALITVAATHPVPTGLVRTEYADEGFRDKLGSEVVDRLYVHDSEPAPGLRAIRWEGRLIVPETGDYSFYGQASGAIRMWLDGELVLDEWRMVVMAKSGYPLERRLSRGAHRIRVDYLKLGQFPAADVTWKGPGIPPRTLIGKPRSLAAP